VALSFLKNSVILFSIDIKIFAKFDESISKASRFNKLSLFQSKKNKRNKENQRRNSKGKSEKLSQIDLNCFSTEIQYKNHQQMT